MKMTDKKEKLQEDAPVTTTANAGTPLVAPELPIQPNKILDRFKKLVKSTKDKKQ